MAAPARRPGKLILLGSIPMILFLAGLLAWRLLSPETGQAEPIAEYWVGEYYGFYSAQGIDSRSGPQSKPVTVRNDEEIDFDWGKGAPAPGLPADQFSVRWTRSVQFDRGVYRFHVKSDDGIRLSVDGVSRLDRWFDNRGAEQTVDIPLAAGVHKLRVDYYENWGNASVKVWWEQVSTNLDTPPTPAPAAPAPAEGDKPAPASSTDAPDTNAPAQDLSISTRASERPAPAGNLLDNGGFELDSNGDGVPDGWTVSIPDSQFTWTDTQTTAPEGRRVALFPPSQKSFTVTQEVDARQNESYEFSGRVNIPSAGGWFRLVLTVIPSNDEGQPLASFEQASFSQATSGWVQVNKRMTMPPYTARARVQLKFDVMRATSYVDDLKFERVGS